MAYKTEELFKTAMSVIKEKKLFFIEDIITLLPCHKSTFYEHFPNQSDNYKEMLAELEKNRVDLKVSMRNKWYKSNAPALQLALMKLISTPEELKKLAMNYNETDVKTNGESLNKGNDITKIADAINKLADKD